jgi:DNA-binding beta-propeller fold protein YncE
LNPEGEVVSVFGEAGDASGYLARPKGIATDSFGNIYIVDALFHVVQVFDMKGNFLYKFGNQGHGNGEFWMPSGIFIDSHDYIYVADTYNSRVQIFQLIHTDK